MSHQKLISKRILNSIFLKQDNLGVYNVLKQPFVTTVTDKRKHLQDLSIPLVRNSKNKSLLFDATISNNFKVQAASDLIVRCNSSQNDLETEQPVSRKQKFKKAIAEYGATVIVFHVGISLMSLGTCYFLVSNGVDVGQTLAIIGISPDNSNAFATNAGTFVAAYAVHKVFAPVRISITLASTPFIVRYLRNVGFLKKPKV